VSYLLGGGWWTLWYALLWLAVTPFVVMTAALTRATPNEPMLAMENAFAVGSVGLFALMGATAISGYFCAVTPRQPMLNRWAAQLLCLTSALLLVFFCVHATWRFRHR
jgi:hypothetical protein